VIITVLFGVFTASSRTATKLEATKTATARTESATDIQDSYENIDKTNIQDGIITINYMILDNLRYKVMIKKDNSSQFYDLTLTGNKNYPLQMGSGDYMVWVLRQKVDDKFSVVYKETVKATIKDSKKVYLQSIGEVNWNENMEVIQKAKELTIDCKTDEAKVDAIYKYVAKSIKYDSAKEKLVPTMSFYITDIEETFETGKGICYDYSSIFASMLRSVGVPTKMVKGYSKIGKVSNLHAWNEVYVNGQWKVVDPTYGASFGLSVVRYENPSNFTKTQEL